MRRWSPILLVLVLLGAGGSTVDPVAEGDRAMEAGDYAAAVVQWSTALRLAQADRDPALEAALLVRLASVDREVGKLSAARTKLERAQGLAGRHDKALGANVGVAWGLLALTAGDLTSAEKSFKDAFREFQAVDDPQGAANAALNLGLARMAQGDLEGAAKAFDGAGRLFEVLGDIAGQGDVQTNLGVAARRDGQLRTAQGHLERALDLYRATNHLAGEADALTNLALVLQELGRSRAAEQLLHDALQTARTRRDVALQATILLELGALAHRHGSTVKARTFYEQAERAFGSVSDERSALSAALNAAMLDGGVEALRAVEERAEAAGDRALLAAVALNRASRLMAEEPETARRETERARKLARELNLAPILWRADYLDGVLALDRGQVEQGTASLQRAVDELERGRLTLDPDAAEQFAVHHQDVYRALAQALVERGDAYGALLQMERLQLSELPGLPDEGQGQVLTRLLARQQTLERALSDELQRLPAGEKSERSDALEGQLASARVEFSASVDRLRAENPELGWAVRVAPEDLEAVQAELEPGVVVVEPVVLEDRLWLLVFSAAGLEAVQVEVGRSELELSATRLARAMQARFVADPQWTIDLADQLGGWLLDPIAPHLAGAEVVVVVKSGLLRQVPFAMLRTGGSWLAERAAVTSVTHVGSLAGRADPGHAFTVEPETTLLVGNPDGTLPAAETEVRAIAQAFPGARVLLGAQGTPDALRERLRGMKTVHLSTHGVLDPEQPDESYLVLYASESDDGRLGYREIPGLAPYLQDCRLVVLSACESGLPLAADPSKVVDGRLVVSIDGLSGQFRRAGVETLVASLWKVSDEGTRALMERFYAELAGGRDIARAMAAAQRELIASKEFSHPWYWAAFAVVGDHR